MLIPRYAEDEAGAMLGEIRSGLVNLGLHGDGAFPPVQAALDRVGDADLQSAFLTAKAKRGKKRQAGGRGMWSPAPSPGREAGRGGPGAGASGAHGVEPRCGSRIMESPMGLG